MSLGKLVLIGNDPACGRESPRCLSFKPTWDSAELKAFAAANGAEMIDAGKTKAPAVYAKWVKALVPAGSTIQFPDLYVLDKAGKTLGHFSKISGNAASVIAKIKALCPDCTDGECGDGGCSIPTTVVCPECLGKKRCKCSQCGVTGKCWKCKGKGKVTV